MRHLMDRPRRRSDATLREFQRLDRVFKTLPKREVTLLRRLPKSPTAEARLKRYMALIHAG